MTVPELRGAAQPARMANEAREVSTPADLRRVLFMGPSYTEIEQFATVRSCDPTQRLGDHATVCCAIELDAEGLEHEVASVADSKGEDAYRREDRSALPAGLGIGADEPRDEKQAQGDRYDPERVAREDS